MGERHRHGGASSAWGSVIGMGERHRHESALA